MPGCQARYLQKARLRKCAGTVCAADHPSAAEGSKQGRARAAPLRAASFLGCWKALSSRRTAGPLPTIWILLLPQLKHSHGDQQGGKAWLPENLARADPGARDSKVWKLWPWKLTLGMKRFDPCCVPPGGGDRTFEDGEVQDLRGRKPVVTGGSGFRCWDQAGGPGWEAHRRLLCWAGGCLELDDLFQLRDSVAVYPAVSVIQGTTC